MLRLVSHENRLDQLPILRPKGYLLSKPVFSLLVAITGRCSISVSSRRRRRAYRQVALSPGSSVSVW